GCGIISGRIEIYYDGTWGTVCNRRFDITDAHVVCRQLGFPAALSLYNYRWGNSRIWLEYVKCDGGESSITACKRNE
ncbi:uncharacterized protein TRIADDRAFT_18144, partial [Trichoplax adhaerens]